MNTIATRSSSQGNTTGDTAWHSPRGALRDPVGAFIADAKEDLAPLRRKARAADAYEIAARRMSARQEEVLSHRPSLDQFDRGWLACLREYGQQVVNASAEQIPEQLS